ncbi:hypothetical protein ACLQ28_17955 [Micromonospora sp. DT201]|uniref:hypothetical protein n=1 Tax=Micromonospora sp. DT201 TaxID=3393442 RepID=UPI003CEEE942
MDTMMIGLSDVTKSFGATRALDGVSLALGGPDLGTILATLACCVVLVLVTAPLAIRTFRRAT